MSLPSVKLFLKLIKNMFKVNILSCFNFFKKQCNGERAKEEASNSFDKLFRVLEDRKNTALRAIETSKSLRMEKLHSQIEEYHGLLENNGLVGYAQEVLKETDPSCFVQTAKQLHDRYVIYFFSE